MEVESSVNGNFSEEDPQTLMLKLREKQKQCEAEEKYIEAENLAKKIEELRQYSHKSTVFNLKSSQKAQKDHLDRAFQEELNFFNYNWDQKIEEFEEKRNQEEAQIEKCNREKVKQETQRLQQAVSSIFKPSSALLNLMKCKEKAVKSKKYMEAQALLERIEETKSLEMDEFQQKRQMKIQQQVNLFKQQLNKELQNLRKRRNTSLTELMKQKEDEYQTLVRKYDNLRRELENNQQIENNKAEGKHTTGAGKHSDKSSFSKILSSTLSTFRSSPNPI